MTTHQRTVTVDGVEVFYRESGPADAQTVLLLHGFPTSSRMYRDLIPLIARKYHVLAPDLPGFGYTARPPRTERSYTFDTAADTIDGLLAALNVTSFVPYMMDFGGSIGWRLIIRHPEQVPAIVLQNAPLYSEDGGDFGVLVDYWRSPTPQTRAAAQDEALSYDNTRGQYTGGVEDLSQLDRDSWEIDYAQLHRPGVEDIVLDYLFDISRQREVFTQARQWLVDTQPPTLIATGRNDRIFSEASMRKFVDDVPTAEFHALNTGHFALATHADEIGALMLDFLDRSLTT